MKLIVLLIILGLLVATTAIILSIKMEEKTQRLYSGPVRPTDDETHFRLTGETIPQEDIDGE